MDNKSYFWYLFTFFLVKTVACGKVRGRLMEKKLGDYGETYQDHGIVCCQVNETAFKVLFKNSEKTILKQIHGDAAFTGQGVNQEILQMSKIPHFNIGGSLHFIVNNQVLLHNWICWEILTKFARRLASPCRDIVEDLQFTALTWQR
jgi:hypothetical protein